MQAQADPTRRIEASPGRGPPRKDVLELGEFIDDGEAALVVVGESKLQATIEKAITKADKRISRRIEMDLRQ